MRNRMAIMRHASTAMTSRYVNFDSDPVRELSNAVGARIAANLEGKSAEVVPLKRPRKG